MNKWINELRTKIDNNKEENSQDMGTSLIIEPTGRKRSCSTPNPFRIIKQNSID
jgi:hypothetical protein